MTKDDDPNCMLKTRFSAARLRDIVLGLKEPRRKLIIDRGWAVLLDICAFSAPKGLLEWIILRIDAELGEFRNSKNKTSIVFNKEMVVKALGLPSGARPVVLTGDHEESPYRDFYKIEYSTAGRRAPIHHAVKLLEDDELDQEVWFRTFFMVVISTYFFPGSSIMMPLEYLGSLGESTLVREYDWAEKIFSHTMSEIKTFQDKRRKALKDGNMKPLWVGGCLPWIAIVYMDHLEFPVSTLSTHRISYDLPRASHVSDADFKFVMKHDKSKLTLQPHTYGARPFRPFHLTPYATVNVILGNEAPQEQILPHIAVSNSNHLGKEAARSPISQENDFPEELPDYIRIVHEKHTNIWRKDVERALTRLTKIHVKRMAEYASDVFAACKNNTTTPHGPSPPSAPTPIFSPPRASTSIAGAPRDEEPMLVGEAVDGSQFWEEATRIAAEIEQSAGRKTHMTDPSSTANARTEHQDITEPTTELRPVHDIECPTFNLLPEGETWTQHFAANNHPSPRGVANISTSTGGTSKNTSGAATIETHLTDVAKSNAPEPATEQQLVAHSVSSHADAADNTASEAPCADVPKFTSPGSQDYKQAPNAECAQSPSTGAATIETHLTDVAKSNAPEPATKQQLVAHSVSSHADAADNTASEAPCADVPKFTSPGSQDYKQAPNAECGQSPSTVECTIGTQTQDKKNRKKRAFLDRNNEAQQKKLKNLKVTDKSKDAYDTYILRRCIRKPVENEKRPPFVDFGEYHVTYEEFREAFKPRGSIDKNVMELFTRDFNLVTNIHTTSEPLCTKFAFSQSLTTKLIVHEDKFDPQTCIKEFQKVYRDHQLKSKDMLYFAIVDSGHWVLVCINLLLKQVNVLDSMIGVKKTRCYDRADFLVNNFIKLASSANAFPKTNFGQFVQNNPQELRQQTTIFDCGVFVMMFMTQWDGKIMKPFNQDLIQLRMLISYKLLTSSLNKVDPTWVLKKK